MTGSDDPAVLPSAMQRDGSCCISCDGYIGPATGLPRDCDECHEVRRRNVPKRIKCPECHKHVRANGMPEHRRMKHGAILAPA